jgi:hypothetical protein
MPGFLQQPPGEGSGLVRLFRSGIADGDHCTSRDSPRGFGAVPCGARGFAHFALARAFAIMSISCDIATLPDAD